MDGSVNVHAHRGKRLSRYRVAFGGSRKSTAGGGPGGRSIVQSRGKKKLEGGWKRGWEEGGGERAGKVMKRLEGLWGWIVV